MRTGLKSALLLTTALGSMGGIAQQAQAACSSTAPSQGQTVTCTGVQQYGINATSTDVTVNIADGATIGTPTDSLGLSAIRLGDRAVITAGTLGNQQTISLLYPGATADIVRIGSGSTLTFNNVTGYGRYGITGTAGGSSGFGASTITINGGGLDAQSTSSHAAINGSLGGNTYVINGYVSARGTSASGILVGNDDRVTVTGDGTISLFNGDSGSVIGGSTKTGVTVDLQDGGRLRLTGIGRAIELGASANVTVNGAITSSGENAAANSGGGYGVIVGAGSTVTVGQTGSIVTGVPFAGGAAGAGNGGQNAIGIYSNGGGSTITVNGLIDTQKAQGIFASLNDTVTIGSSGRITTRGANRAIFARAFTDATSNASQLLTLNIDGRVENLGTAAALYIQADPKSGTQGLRALPAFTTVGATGTLFAQDAAAYAQADGDANYPSVLDRLTIAGRVERGTSGTVIDLGTGSDTFTLLPTATIIGGIVGGDGFFESDSFYLQGDTGSGTFDFSTTPVSGFETFNKSGNSTWRLLGDTGNNFGPQSGSFDFTVSSGTLLVDGQVSTRLLLDGGRVGGTGTIRELQSGSYGHGRIIGVSGQTLNFGRLTLETVADQFGSTGFDLTLGAPTLTPIFLIDTSVTAGGTVSIADGGGFGYGTYRLFQYGGANGFGGNFTDDGLTIDQVPLGYNPGDFTLDSSTRGVVDLIVASGNGTQFWDGSNTSPGAIANGRGGSGTWNGTNTNWTNVAGSINAPWAEQAGNFAGTAGTVTVDGTQPFSQLSFLTTGYQLNGGNAGILQTVAGGSEILTGANITASFSGIDFSGSGVLHVGGSGTVDIAQDAIAPNLQVEGGTLNLSGANAGNIAVGAGILSLAATAARDVTVGGLLTAAGATGTNGSARTLNVGYLGSASFNGTGFTGSTDPANGLDTVTQSSGSLQLQGGRVSAALSNGSGILMSGGTLNVAGTTVTTSGLDGEGVNVRSSSDATLDQAVIVTSGDGARGVAATGGNRATVTITNSRISTLGQLETGGDGLGSYGLGNVSVGTDFPSTINAADTAIYTGGRQGIGAGAAAGTINIRGGTIVTGIRINADGTPVPPSGQATTPFVASGAAEAIGAGATYGALITIAADQNGARPVIATYGDASPGLGAEGTGSRVEATNADIETFGTTANSMFGNIASHGAAVVNGATINVADSTIVSHGAGAAGAFVLQSGSVSLSGTTVQASGAALGVSQGGTITATGSTLAGTDSALFADFSANGQVAGFTIAGGSASSGAGKLLAVRRASGVTGGTVNIAASNGAALAGDIDALQGTSVVFTGANADTGTLRLLSGTLNVNGTLASSSLPVSSGAILQGTSSIAGAVSVADGGILAGRATTTLTTGSLRLSDNSIVTAALGQPGLATPLFNVTGALSLDGRLTVSDAAGFGYGSYRLFNYGTLAANNGLVVTNVPAGYNAGDFSLDVATPGQVSLNVAEGAGAQYWDGPNQTPGSVANGRGGNGTWNAANTNWTNQAGTINAPSAGGTALFKTQAAAFTNNNVTIEGTQSITGLTLLAGARYRFTAGANGGLLLGAGETPFTIDRNNDASQTGGLAFVDAPISGSGALVKAGEGVLELDQANSYAGGTRIASGTLYASADGSLGSGAITVSGSSASLVVGLSSFSDRNADVDLGDRDITIRDGGSVTLFNASTLGAATLSVEGISSGYRSELAFSEDASAGASQIRLGADGLLTVFSLGSLAGATVVNGAGGDVDISRADGDVGIGSLSGAGDLYLGFNRALIGALGGDDTISGVITDNTTDGGRTDAAPTGIVKQGSGTLTLAGANTYGGVTEVTGGRLLVTGSVIGDVRVGEAVSSQAQPQRAAAIGVAAVPSPALGGSGTIGGAVTIEDGAVLEGATGQTLSMASLTLAPDAMIDAALGAPSATRLFNVTGNLTLDGTLNVTDAGGFGAGVYRLIDYGGSLNDNGLALGTLPGSSTAQVQTALANQVNLVVAGDTPDQPDEPDQPTPAPDVQFWNGTTTSPAGTVVGGSGTWTTAPVTNWTDANGSRSDAWAGKFAVFQAGGGASSGAVAVDDGAGAVSVKGMQFISQGWTLGGDAVALAGDGGETRIRVGDGSQAGASSAAVITARLTGASTLVKDDLGTLTLAGSNDYTGGTRVAAGTLRIGDGGTTGSISGDVMVDGALEFARSDSTSFGGTISGQGELRVASGNVTLTKDNSFGGATRIAEAATLRLGNGGGSGALAGPIVTEGTLIFDRADRYTYGNPFSGDGILRQAGSGTAVLTGSSGAFAGTAEVTAGTLVVNGVLGGTVAVRGGRLQGGGTIGAITVGSGSTVAPGNSIGTLSVAGDVSFAPGAVYEVDVDPSGASDRIAASGGAAIGGGTVDVLAAAGRYALNIDYTILTAQGGVTGAFDAAASNSAFLAPSLAYGTNSVTLRLTRNGLDLAGVGGSPNQRSAGAAVDALGANAIYTSALLLSAEQARSAFDALSGEVHSSARTAIIEDSRLPREAVLRRLTNAPDDGHGAWGELFGNWAWNDPDGNAARVSRDTKGFVAGIDAAAGEHWRIGLAGGYTDTDLGIGARASNATLKTAHVLGYARARYGALRLKGGVGYAHVDVHTRRDVAFSGFSDSVKASYDARVFQAFGEVGYALPLEGGSVEPFANLAYVDVRTDGFGEHGGDAALSAGKRYASYTASMLGLRAETPAIGAFSAHASLGWRHAFGDLIQRTRLSFAGGAPFAIAGARLSRDSGLAEVGLNWQLSPSLQLNASYTGVLGSRSEDHAARARLSFAF